MIQPVGPPAGRPLVCAVTGTNGKTSVATATLQLMREIGWRAAGYDSTGISDVDGELHTARVRRSPAYLPDMIEYQARAGAQAISLEAFVGLLADGLFDRVEVDTAVCTGLERDHLNVHRSIEAYWGAKLSLFEEHLRPDGVAVMSNDCVRGDRVRAAVSRRGARLVTVGTAGDLRLADAREREGMLSGSLRIGADSFPVTVPTVHSVAVTNLLLAAAAVIAAGGAPKRSPTHWPASLCRLGDSRSSLSAMGSQPWWTPLIIPGRCAPLFVRCAAGPGAGFWWCSGPEGRGTARRDRRWAPSLRASRTS